MTARPGGLGCTGGFNDTEGILAQVLPCPGIRTHSGERDVIEALLGAAAGVLTIVLARVIRGQRWLYSIGLLVLPGLYALFALRAGERAVGVYLLWLSRRVPDADLGRA